MIVVESHDAAVQDGCCRTAATHQHRLASSLPTCDLRQAATPCRALGARSTRCCQIWSQPLAPIRPQPRPRRQAKSSSVPDDRQMLLPSSPLSDLTFNCFPICGH
jgi:hypothetical protein